MRKFLASILLKLHDALDGGYRLACLAYLNSRERVMKDALIKSQLGPEPFRFQVAPDWTEEDTVAFAKFLSTPTGAALKARLQAMVATVCIGGCQQEINTAHAAGCGAGWEECVRKLLEHAKFSRVAGVQATNNESPPAEEELLARFSA